MKKKKLVSLAIAMMVFFSYSSMSFAATKSGTTQSGGLTIYSYLNATSTSVSAYTKNNAGTSCVYLYVGGTITLQHKTSGVKTTSTYSLTKYGASTTGTVSLGPGTEKKVVAATSSHQGRLNNTSSTTSCSYSISL